MAKELTRQSKSGKARPPVMREVECLRCGQIVGIVPWSTRCPACFGNAVGSESFGA